MALDPKAESVLSGWHAQKPVIALMGEFSAGKSTLLNLLLDGDHLPTKVTATNLPAVWVTHSKKPFTEGLTHDGRLEPVSVDSLGDNVRDDYLLLRFGIDADLLTRTDVIDTPGISDPKLAKGATLFLAPYLDGVLWLSPANQAWRQSEKVVWSEFPKTLHDTSIVVMTRADKLRRKSDLTKVMKRVASETKALFAERVSLNTPLAAQSKGAPESKDWEKSGGLLFMAAFEKLLGTAAAQHAERKPAEKAVQTPAEPEVVDAPIEELKPLAAEKYDGGFSALTFLKSLSDSKNNDCDFGQIKSIFDHSAAQLDAHTSVNPLHKDVLKQCLSAGEDENANVERLLEQAKQEIADFDQDCWCVIAPQ